MFGALVAAAVAAVAATPAWHPDVRAARHYAAGRPGRVAFAVRTRCGEWGSAQDRIEPTASVLKPMLLLTYLQQRAVRDRRLTHAERRLLTPMIRRSANGPADQLVYELGAARIDRAGRRWGLHHLRVRSPWGLTEITARDQTRLWLKIDRLFPARHRAFAMHLLQRIIRPQRWGIARVAPRGWTLYFKSGWGSGTGFIDNQVALLTRGRERVSVAILTRFQGTHAAGEATLKGVARRLLRGLGRAPAVCG